eukprot:444216_1
MAQSNSCKHASDSQQESIVLPSTTVVVKVDSDSEDSEELYTYVPPTTEGVNDMNNVQGVVDIAKRPLVVHDRHRKSTDISEMYGNKRQKCELKDDTPRKAQKSIQRDYVLIAAKGVSRCTDCSQVKHGKVYEADGQFYCNECWNSYQ